MLEKRYEPRVRDNKVTIIDNRYAFVYLLMLFMMAFLLIAFIICGAKDKETLMIVVIGIAVGFLFFAFLISGLECKYVIRPESISIMYGIFGKKIHLDKVTQCFYNSKSYITLLDEKGKENTIDLTHLYPDSDKFFTDALRNMNVRIREIGDYVETTDGTNFNYRFDMKQKDAAVIIVIFLFMALFLDSVFLAGMPGSDFTVRLLLLAFAIGNTALWLFFAEKLTCTVSVKGEIIEVRRWFKKTRSINVKDISWVHTELKHHSNRYGGKDIEEMEIHLGDEILKLPVNIGRAYTNYDLFVAYLQDNGVPFSLADSELYTYEEAKEDSEKDIPELFNLNEHAFTVDDNYIIENGIFAGKKFNEELFQNVGSTDTNTKNRVMANQILGKIASIMYFANSFVFIAAMLLLRAKVIGVVTAFAVPLGVFIGVLLLSVITELLNYLTITKDASRFAATVFHAHTVDKELTVVYAYDAGDEVRLAEPLFLNSNLKQKDYEALYNVPTYIWANPQNSPLCVEGTDTKPLGKGKTIAKLVILAVLEIAIIIGCVFIHRVSAENSVGEKTENTDRESILYTYDVNYEEDLANGTDLAFKDEDTEMSTATYKWAAEATTIYSYLEGGNTKYIGGHSRADNSGDEAKEFLEKAWKISDRDSAMEVIDKQITYGHQAKCRAYIQSNSRTKKAIEALERDYGQSFSFEDSFDIDEAYFEENNISTKDFYNTKGAACAYMRFGENGLAAYDYMRLIRVIKICYDCEYLSADECMGLIHNMELAIQKQYGSFEEINECYLYGEMFRVAGNHSNNNLNDIAYALNEIRNDNVYAKSDIDFGTELTIDWKELLTKRDS